MLPCLRPIRRINSVAGTVVAATLMTMIEIGNVANALFCVRLEPIMPPSVTSAIEPVAEISWQVRSIDRFRTDMSRAFSHNSSRIIAAC